MKSYEELVDFLDDLGGFVSAPATLKIECKMLKKIIREGTKKNSESIKSLAKMNNITIEASENEYGTTLIKEEDRFYACNYYWFEGFDISKLLEISKEEYDYYLIEMNKNKDCRRITI